MRLIDAEKLAEVLNRYFAAPHVQLRNSDISVGLRMGIKTCLTFLNNANTIEAEPVRHGRWEVSTDEWFETDVYTCSKCRESYVLVEGTPKENLWNYCPNCGAKMGIKDGGDNDAAD